MITDCAETDARGSRGLSGAQLGSDGAAELVAA
jgi:hypothetical protein